MIVAFFASAGDNNEVSESQPLVDMAMAYSRSRIVCAAARLRIADALAAGEQTVANLAETCAAHPASLHRLLRAMASIGIVTESNPGTFALTSMGQTLRRDVADSAWPAVIFWADLLADNWSHLTDCVRTGDRASDVMARAGVTSRWSTDPDAGAVFRAVMGTAPPARYDAVAAGLDLKGSGVVADLGGGGGSLLVAILNQQPERTGMLVDRQASIESAAPLIEKAGLSGRCRLIAADLLESIPAGADAYILKHVLHGYGDEKAVQILKNCAANLPEKGRVLIVEFVLPAEVNQVDPALEKCLMSDLNMLAVTGGKERTESEWVGLIEQAGLHFERRVAIQGDLASVLEASRFVR